MRSSSLGRREFALGAAVACVTLGSTRARADDVASFPLFDAFPALAARLPRASLGAFPSPVDASRTISPGALWVKRDDVIGGGKTRKLELLFGDAIAKGAREIVTFGGVGSNQALAVALFARANGMRARLWLAPQARSALVSRNLPAAAATGAELALFPSVADAIAKAHADFAAKKDVYVIPPGATTPLGTLGFVNAGMELARDVAAGRLPRPARVYVALGLGGTAVGLGIGCALTGLATEIVAVRASQPTTVTEPTLREIHRATMEFARELPALSFQATHVRIDGRFLGAGYGVPTTAGDGAIARAHGDEAWSLDPVYTGKAFAALLEDREHAPHGPLLFWNTMSSQPVASADVPQELRRFL